MQHAQFAGDMLAARARVVVEQRHLQLELLRAMREKTAVADADELAIERFAGRGKADLRPDPGRLPAGERDSRRLQSLYST